MVVSIVAATVLPCSLCISLFALVSVAAGLVAVVLGIVARRQIIERAEGGAGMALAGIVTGGITAGLGIALMVVLLALVAGLGLLGSEGGFS